MARFLRVHPTYELLIPLVYGEVPEGGGHGADDSVHLHAKEFHQDGQTLLLPHSRPKPRNNISTNNYIYK